MTRRTSINTLASVLVAAAALGLGGCFPSTAVVPEYMTVSPHLLTYTPPETVHTMSLSHSCSCPITWTILPPANTPWLHVGTSQVGDIAHDSVVIDRSLLTLDTTRALLQISTGEYKTQSGNLYDTVQVIVIK